MMPGAAHTNFERLPSSYRPGVYMRALRRLERNALLCAAGFGQQPQQPGFGMQQQQMGTKNVTYQKVAETEGGTGTSSRTTVHFCSLMAMPQFRDANEKSPLELRWEDYQVRLQPTRGVGFGELNLQWV